MAKEIVEFVDVKLNEFYINAVLNLDISQYPEPLQSILRIIQIKGAIAAPAAINEALMWVYNNQINYHPE